MLIKGTTIGTATDSNGGYTLNVPAANNTLVFSFIGFKTAEVEIGSSTKLDVSMEPDAMQLTELVVVGYGNSDQTRFSRECSAGKGR